MQKSAFQKCVIISGFGKWSHMDYTAQVAYHGIPTKAYEVFTTALKARYLEKGFALPELEDQNPAGMFVLCVYVELM